MKWGRPNDQINYLVTTMVIEQSLTALGLLNILNFVFAYRVDTITDPLKKIELFKALASPAFIGKIVTLFGVCFLLFPHSSGQPGELQRDECWIFLPSQNVLWVCLWGQLQVTAGAGADHKLSFRKSTIPEYKREYEEIEIRWEISNEYVVELFSRPTGNNKVNYMAWHAQTSHRTNCMRFLSKYLP